jgi:hypothetical protein
LIRASTTAPADAAFERSLTSCLMDEGKLTDKSATVMSESTAYSDSQ